MGHWAWGMKKRRGRQGRDYSIIPPCPPHLPHLPHLPHPLLPTPHSQLFKDIRARTQKDHPPNKVQVSAKANYH